MEMLLRPVELIVKKMAEQLLRPIGRQIAYLVHYKENIEKLDEEIREIGDNWGGLQRKVDEARIRGEIVEDNVCQRLTDVDQKKQEVDQFLGKQRQEHKRCFHFCSRYSMSKEAKKKTDALIKLKNTECEFERISHPAPPPEFGFQSSAYYMTFESRASIFTQIMEALKNNSVNLIGIYGIGGVGKTTMVEEVGKQVKKDGIFDEVVMAVVSETLKFQKIQEQLADRLDLQLMKKTDVGRAGELLNRLNNGKRNLVILDDIWEELNLKDVGIPIGDGVKGCCKVVLTSRIQDVCQMMGLLLEGTRNKKNVKMHDVIRDVAISIAKEKEAFLVKQGVHLEEWPEEDVYKCCKVISLRYENIVQYPHVLECLELHSLMVGVNKYSITNIPDDFFNGIRKLKVLDLSCGLLRSLPSSLSNLSTLRLLCLRDCCFEDISILGDLKNLEMVEVGGSLITKLPLEIKNLNRLRLLDLRSCISLEVIPPNVISSLYRRLEELYLPKQFGGWEVEATKIERRRASVDELEKLSHLTSLEIYIPKKVSFLPKEIPFQKLTRFNISVGRVFHSQYDSIYSTNYTKILNLGDITLKDEFKVLLEKTAALHLVLVEGLEKLLHSKEKVMFTGLKFFKVERCHGIKHLFSSQIGYDLGQLQYLEILICENMEEIIGNDQRVGREAAVVFEELKTMKLVVLTNLRSFYPKLLKPSNSCSTPTQALFNEKVAFPSLEDLTIDSLHSIGGICDNQSKSFSKLRCLNVYNCDNLRNVLSFSVARNLVHLREIKISRCPKMEVILAIVAARRKEGQGEESNDEIVNFPALTTLSFWNLLPKLKSFCNFESKKEDEEVEDNDTPETQLFNQKVAFPSLEDLTIYSLPRIGEIWDNQSESFSQLRRLYVSNCDNLRNVFSFSITCNLVHPQEIMISSCQGQGEESNDEIINFPALRTLELWKLPKLKSFCNFRFKKEDDEEVKDKDNDTLEAQLLFNQKLTFPALERLEVYGLDCIREIWANRLAFPALKEESFSQLKYLCVKECPKLVNVVPANMLPRLQYLEGLMVDGCKSVLYLVEGAATTGKDEQANDDEIIFPLLGTLELIGLSELKGFYNSGARELNLDIFSLQPFFNHKVALPSLEDLTIKWLPSIGQIWDNQSGSFGQLRKLYVSNCDNLRNVFSFSIARNLVHLQKIKISSCPKMEVILATVEARRKEGQGEESNDAILNFPALRTLKLENLPKLKSFCNFKFRKEDDEEVKDKDNDTLEAQIMFNQKVTFPALEKLKVGGLDCIKEIWANRLAFPALKEESFSQLKYLHVKNCDELVNVVPANMLPRLQYLEKLEVDGCKSVLSFVGGAATTRKDEQANDDKIIFPQLRTLKLIGLSKLKSFYNSEAGELDLDIVSLQSFFNHKVAFPSLEDLTIKQ